MKNNINLKNCKIGQKVKTANGITLVLKEIIGDHYNYPYLFSDSSGVVCPYTESGLLYIGNEEDRTRDIVEILPFEEKGGMDLSSLKTGDKVRLRSGKIATVRSLSGLFSPTYPIDLLVEQTYGESNCFHLTREGKYRDDGSESLYDIVELLPKPMIDLSTLKIGAKARCRNGEEVVFTSLLPEEDSNFPYVFTAKGGKTFAYTNSGTFFVVSGEDRRDIVEILSDGEGEATVDAESPVVKPTTDPWQGRSQHMRCKTCMWFAPKAGEIGRCRRHAPTMSGFPVVFTNDWCGDHKLNEEAS
ncbi:hypothetical protein SCBWM1_gp51 [Synechococcus phage S-CBWM1]|uniref:Uncharacterized protein n=1 Tax=Synechococcus phage S-CBWM1 TaxID=2053653 RepID=A0A3G1L3H7_9CAUD|nr:hypothetical protein HOU61_gp146 [Synechococcus phage S-CBWM1]ATW62735.1 hypothetical protein SCBWM1_gp51 [Synechococcus phage S-CBWM1]